MVDEYEMPKKDIDFGVIGSDSSMVDEYEGEAAEAGQPQAGSDSSMVDEYPESWAGCIQPGKVQIPLWSMSTVLENQC